ncbi:MAG: DUF2007 domain-containing protein [Bacteroidales bacterium]|nr:DUF2007 domain-containing protein [Bacteroidales bacterium]
MAKDMTLVYTIDQSCKAQLILDVLEENSIEVVIINKKDSSFKSFGEFEVYVAAKDEEKAKGILEKMSL